MARSLRILLACLALGAADLAAQSTTGRISGSVRDSSGAVLPGATVTVTQEGTGLARTTITDGVGNFVFVSLPVGSYTVTAELAGFKKALRTGYQLVADGRLTADFSLDVGQVAEVIQVTV